VKETILLSYHQQHQWRLFKEKLELVPRLIEDMEEVRLKMGNCAVTSHRPRRTVRDQDQSGGGPA
jgi:hypothetical protein